jgi:hypothetical protein
MDHTELDFVSCQLNSQGMFNLCTLSLGAQDFVVPQIYIPVSALTVYLPSFCIGDVASSFGLPFTFTDIVWNI